jgi:hypothetical protein
MIRLRLVLNLVIARRLRQGEISADRAARLRRAIRSDEALRDLAWALLAEAVATGAVAETALTDVEAFDWSALWDFLWQHREEILAILLMLFGL